MKIFKIHKEGFTSILLLLANALMISFIILYFSGYTWYSWVIIGVLMGFVLFVINFFRMPTRKPLGNSTEISAPADGKVIIVEEVEENEYLKTKVLKISIFMSVFNVHANWYPLSGKVSYYKYHPGDYLAAWHPKSSEKNERTTIVVKNKNGVEVLFRQIAGLLARRIVCYTSLGKDIKAGEEVGFIKFGSRADVYLPLGTEICVKVGDKVVGAETIIAKLK